MIRRIKKTTETTPISSEVVNTFSNSTKDAYACGYINDLVEEVYSTDEVKTNKVWIDGKPIYRKVISVNSPSSAGVYTTIANMGSNVVNTLVSATSMILVSYAANNKVFYNLNIDEGDANHYCLIAYNQSNGNIQAKVGTELRNQPITIVLEYTKTTD